MRPSAASQNVPLDLKDFASDVEYYLGLEPRQLPSRYLYDALGSALFDTICELPWYGITRAELGLLGHARPRDSGPLRHADEAVAHRRAGAGQRHEAADADRSGDDGPAKAGHYVRQSDGQGNARQGYGGQEAGHYVPGGRPVRRGRLELHLVDVSVKALDKAGEALAALDDVEIVKHQATYESGLREVAQTGVRTLVLFLGSNIGNFDRPGADAFLRSIRAALVPGDDLLVGADLVKPEVELLLAYDDPLGVTAAFNRNLLVRINRELGGDFDIDAFGHRAVWNRDESRVEMHLVSRRRQRVRVPSAHIDLTMKEGETIWTESSYKYEPDEAGDAPQALGISPGRALAGPRRAFPADARPGRVGY